MPVGLAAPFRVASGNHHVKDVTLIAAEARLLVLGMAISAGHFPHMRMMGVGDLIDRHFRYVFIASVARQALSHRRDRRKVGLCTVTRRALDTEALMSMLELCGFCRMRQEDVERICDRHRTGIGAGKTISE